MEENTSKLWEIVITALISALVGALGVAWYFNSDFRRIEGRLEELSKGFDRGKFEENRVTTIRLAIEEVKEYLSDSKNVESIVSPTTLKIAEQYLDENLKNDVSKMFIQLAPEIVNIIKKEKLIPPGTIIPLWGANKIPNGWLLCNGIETIPKTSNLYKMGLKSTPDLRGLFLRGAGQNSDKNLRYNEDSDHKVGNFQTDTLQNHGHQVYFDYAEGASIRSIPGWHDNRSANGIRTAVIGMSANEMIENKGGKPRPSDKTRPKNVAVNFIMKY